MGAVLRHRDTGYCLAAQPGGSLVFGPIQQFDGWSTWTFGQGSEEARMISGETAVDFPPMPIDPEVLLNTILSQAVRGTVKWRRLAGNSLLLYVDCEPGDPAGLTFWFDPTWHVRGPGRVLAGSREAQFEEDDPDEQERLEQFGQRLEILVGTTVEGVDIEPDTFDLTLRLSGGYLVRTFAADATDDKCWHIRANSTELALKGSPSGLTVLVPRAGKGRLPHRP